MHDISTSNSLADLAARIRTAARTTLEHAIQVGELLIEAKRLVAHGDWTTWLEGNCDLSERMAQNYMRLARHPSKPKLVSDLDPTIKGAIKSLAKPKPEETASVSNLDTPTDSKEQPAAKASEEFTPTPEPPITGKDKKYVLLDDWRQMDSADRALVLKCVGKKELNKQENADIEWADWSWNPVTGCEHKCSYCYAHPLAEKIYPPEVGFRPAIWIDRLTAPQNQKVPMDADANVARKNIFTCSMADLFGRWVPEEVIERVLGEAADNPQWNFLFLTKFPKRIAELKIPTNAWMGTTVDLQARVANAEKAFEKLREAGVRCWLSVEPMLQPLKFNRLELFEWIVIGGASPSKAADGKPATPGWTVPIDWIVDLHQQARNAGCKIYYKTNSGLTGEYTRIREFPGHEAKEIKAPSVFNYLGNIPSKEQTTATSDAFPDMPSFLKRGAP
jgi:protein gp37